MAQPEVQTCSGIKQAVYACSFVHRIKFSYFLYNFRVFLTCDKLKLLIFKKETKKKTNRLTNKNYLKTKFQIFKNIISTFLSIEIFKQDIRVLIKHIQQFVVIFVFNNTVIEPQKEGSNKLTSLIFLFCRSLVGRLWRAS